MADKQNSELKAEVDREKLLGMSEIALWLDTYDDIFSDFDPRPFIQRALSIDFLDEIKRASREKVSGQIELKFLVPRNQRSIETDLQIKKRLKEHFKKHHEQLKIEKNKVVRTGILVASLGFFNMFLAVILHSLLGEILLTTILTTLLEPSGWFMMFYGLDRVFYGGQSKKPDIEFYGKMSNADISFISY